MSTQGILSILRNGKVTCKIVAGCNGYNIPKLAKNLRKHPTEDVNEIRRLCEISHVGCADCLVVQSGPNEAIMPDEDFLQGYGWKLYREKFFDPNFNPRWEHGTAAYTEIVEL